MSEVKLVKVDNWGIYFLQRLKHFFNRTDFCDLTLQFQDNAQLKVHRLVLSACTEYFELLERTCEMYEDCLVMPDDLQADVVVPIVNFMYTGQLEFRMELLERLHQTSQIMNMPVLTKLLDAHRNQMLSKGFVQTPPKRSYSKPTESSRGKQTTPIAATSSTNSTYKRSFSKAFGNTSGLAPKEKKQLSSISVLKSETTTNNGISPTAIDLHTFTSKKAVLGEPRPTRYELPEELDTDNIFDNSFTNISYGSTPLMVHPTSTKRYPAKKNVFCEASSSKEESTIEMVQFKKIPRRNDNIFEDDVSENISEEIEMFSPTHIKNESLRESSHLFDQILNNHEGPKVTIETKDAKQAHNIDHAKIISEVLKKYPHLVKSNKNIKLKILNTPTAANKSKKQRNTAASLNDQEVKQIKLKTEEPGYTYETDVLDSKEAAKLIAMGAENIRGPWICLICGTPGRALHFTSYYKFRRHLVEVHNEKPIVNICEYCGLKSLKRNYLLHHLYTKHGVEPPQSYHFPKCNLCNYVALTEGFLVKHKLSHSDNRNFRCNVCSMSYNSSNQLLQHIQATGHKYSADRKTNLLCIYCLKVFLRESNLYAHLKTNHKHVAKNDGIIDDSDEDTSVRPITKSEPSVKFEPTSFGNEYEEMDTQYQIRPDGNIQIITSKKMRVATPQKQKILNSGFTIPVDKATQKPTSIGKASNVRREYIDEISISSNKHEEIVMIDNNEYIMRDNELIPRKKSAADENFIISDMIQSQADPVTSPRPIEFINIHKNISELPIQDQKVVGKKSTNLNQPIQIVVSNDEEYKALMNSNHSIIFDNDDSNKTLTVLSAPHSTALSTSTIDLENTEPSDMMLIQDNYPLNVTEDLPVDNSNIVVVYSHPVSDVNKPYQLITSQDIGAQLIQSSAVITQNYETITTSTPVTSDNVIDTQEPESWQNNIPNQEMLAQPVIELQEISVGEKPDTHMEVDTSSEDLPEVSITTVVEESQEDVIHNRSEENVNDNVSKVVLEQDNQDMDDIVEDTHQEQEINEHVIQVVQNADQVVENEDHMDENVEEAIQGDSSLTIMEVNVSSEPAPEKNIEESKEEIIVNESLPQEDTTEIIELNEEHLEKVPTLETKNPVEIKQPLQEANLDKQSENQDNDSTKIEEVTENTDDNADDADPPINKENVPLPKEIKEQINNLASEWSEDEYDIEPQQTSKSDAESKKPAEVEIEVEESIENIQQEMQKQVSVTVEGYTDIEEEITSSQEETSEFREQKTVQTNVPIVATKAKISSLLNDWEDNESQEGNDSANGNKEVEFKVSDDLESAPIEESTSTIEAAEASIEVISEKKIDKIKSLVSDWDDDEEEKE